MKRILWSVLIVIPVFLHAQEKGIHFENGLSWKQVKAKAKLENKFIFLDCYATWCGPCKQMDKDVYPNEQVGHLMNDRFVSVKVQIDSSKSDNDFTRSWYEAAKGIQENYEINALPSFLFFNKDGKAVHKSVGYKDTIAFKEMVSDVFKPDKQYYVLREQFQANRLDFNKMKNLADIADAIGDKSFSLDVAKTYMHGYLDKLGDADFCSKDNLEFIIKFQKMITSKDKVFRLAYTHYPKMDTVTAIPSLCSKVVDLIIINEEIKPYTKSTQIENVPDWQMIERNITKKYSRDYAERLVLKAKTGWYSNKDWEKCTEYIVEGVEKYGLDCSDLLGTYGKLTTIYKHTDNIEKLKKALLWMEEFSSYYTLKGEKGIKDFRGALDTYAGLLYRTGKRKEGIEMMQKYIPKPGLDKNADKILGKMKNGEELLAKNWNSKF